ncbi:UNVERIFIED_CONTAM: hypothetical protein Sangu_0188000, partial [Sesamum angustifolium]
DKEVGGLKQSRTIRFRQPVSMRALSKRKMTKKVFVGKSSPASDLLDLVLPDVYGTFNTQVRGGFTYFITFITDHSQCGYVYLMKYKFEAKFKEFRPEVENQIGSKTKVLRLDRRSEL